jgi:hypothetical protein
MCHLMSGGLKLFNAKLIVLTYIFMAVLTVTTEIPELLFKWSPKHLLTFAFQFYYHHESKFKALYN